MAQEGSGGERTEKATPKKRKDARERGQVRKSMELVSAVMLLALFGVLRLTGPGMWERMGNLTRVALAGKLRRGELLTAASISPLMTEVVTEFALILLPILAAAVITGLAANLVQVGFLFSTKALTPKMSRINPLSGLKRMFSLHTLFELAKAILKVAVVGVVAYQKYQAAIGSFARTAWQSPIDAARDLLLLITDIGLAMGVALLILAALDYLYQWWKYEKDLMMSKYEVKLEYRQQEGDPQVKGRIKQKQRQMATMRMMQAVPEADVVITNPTHYAVALKYDEALASAPLVTAKGQDYVAMKIKEIAKEHGVEIVENKPVAQALYAACDLGAEVPLELYQAVAEILAYVYKLKRKGR